MGVGYGQLPETVGTFEIDVQEMMFYLYLPIRMKGSREIKIPKRLKIFLPLIAKVTKANPDKDNYIYLTAKRLVVTKGNAGNRAGIHSDGFMTDDVNYIWYDCLPTKFYNQPFEVEEHHINSMRQFKEQANENNVVHYPNNTLLRLTPKVIHDVPRIVKPQLRTFVKISVSKHKYNLIGNSKNHLFDYNWKMYDRGEVRNHPTYNESDFVQDVDF